MRSGAWIRPFFTPKFLSETAMLSFRDKVQQQVFLLNGLAMSDFDLSQPTGDPGVSMAYG